MKYWVLGIHRLIYFMGAWAGMVFLFIIILKTLAEVGYDDNTMRIATLLWGYTFIATSFYAIRFFTKWSIPPKDLDARQDKG